MSQYCGRFAPSPTGLLHFGSLLGALASYLDAKANHGKWLLRMEDLDPPREMKGAAQAILQSLQDHGLHWDEPVLWQSQRSTAYQQTIEQLIAQHLAFYCCCSRSDLEHYKGVYPGHCRGCNQQPAQDFAIRLQVANRQISFSDIIQGLFSQQLEQQVGDFVLLRKDRFFAYQLAVTVDDNYQGITHVVRGSDLLDTTPRQLFLQQQLGYRSPHYAHIPVITNQQGQKLSKQNLARPLDSNRAGENLIAALAFLNQPLPSKTITHDINAIILWAVEHWSINRIPKVMSITQSL